MNILRILSSAALLAASVSVQAQVNLPAQSDPGMKAPSDPGMSKGPDSAAKPPAASGMEVVPPKTDPEAITTPPANIDPGIRTSPPKTTNGKSKRDKPQGEDAGKQRE